jgi:hypothetical protein
VRKIRARSVAARDGELAPHAQGMEILRMNVKPTLATSTLAAGVGLAGLFGVGLATANADPGQPCGGPNAPACQPGPGQACGGLRVVGELCRMQLSGAYRAPGPTPPIDAGLIPISAEFVPTGDQLLHRN